ncbi:DNA repair exonuclease [Candidatus Woesearchaeota archaeon]|nr:DNA repair exonuclease [Candidatus Woesearchaeota archaeon]
MFAHLADVHIGAWRDPKMKELAITAFEKTIESILSRGVDFVIIAGDLFNTSVPPIDQVKRTVTQLQKLKEAKIPVYAIAGSHDYSPSGKTMLDVLEEAELLVNVMKGKAEEGKLTLTFTQDPKTQIKLTGILGRAGSLDKHYYEDLDMESLEKEDGKKIFLFHASITELKPKALEHMDSSPVSMMPKGFDYYAGGHVHITNEISVDGYKNVVYPGPLFPANFSELEELGQGGFVFVNDDWAIERVPVLVKERKVFLIDAEKKDVETINVELAELVKEDVKDKIILIRAKGELAEGRVSDIKFKEFIKHCNEQGAFAVMKNTAKLTSKEFEEYQQSHGSTDDVEAKVIKEHLGQTPIGLDAEAEAKLTKAMLDTLGEEQHEGEKKYEYEERVVKSAKELLR